MQPHPIYNHVLNGMDVVIDAKCNDKIRCAANRISLHPTLLDPPSILVKPSGDQDSAPEALWLAGLVERLRCAVGGLLPRGIPRCPAGTLASPALRHVMPHCSAVLPLPLWLMSAGCKRWGTDVQLACRYRHIMGDGR